MNTLLTGMIAALGGHFANGFAALADKYLLKQAFQAPIFYVFWIGLISAAVMVLLPFQFVVPHGAMLWLLNVLAGATFSIALFFYFSAVGLSDLSTVVPVVGSLTTAATAVVSYALLAERLSAAQGLAIILLLAGFWLLAGSKRAIPAQALWPSVVGALFFALSSVSMKQLFTLEPFIPALVFSRLGSVLVSLLIFMVPDIRTRIFSLAKGFGYPNLMVLLADHGAGAVGFTLLNLGVKLASPTIVSALQGAQYAFLFLLVTVMRPFAPKVFDEARAPHEVIRKLAGIGVIGIGIALLATLS